MHNVYFVQYVFLPTEQAETYLKISVLIYHLTYICPSLFGWKENMIFEEIVMFKLLICYFGVILTDFECSKNKFLLPENKKRDKFYSFHPKTI